MRYRLGGRRVHDAPDWRLRITLRPRPAPHPALPSWWRDRQRRRTLWAPSCRCPLAEGRWRDRRPGDTESAYGDTRPRLACAPLSAWALAARTARAGTFAYILGPHSITAPSLPERGLPLSQANRSSALVSEHSRVEDSTPPGLRPTLSPAAASPATRADGPAVRSPHQPERRKAALTRHYRPDRHSPRRPRSSVPRKAAPYQTRALFWGTQW